MSAREAMEKSEFFGINEHWDGARFWLDFARELREEAASRRAWKAFEPVVPAPLADEVKTETIPAWREPVPEGTRCEHCGYFLMVDAGELVHTRTLQAVCPVGRPGPDDTIVHTLAKPE